MPDPTTGTPRPPTICKCGTAKDYHRPEDHRDHEYEPRYDPDSWQEGYRKGRAEASAGVDVDAAIDDVRYAGGNGTSDYWRGFNDGIDRLAARLSSPVPPEAEK